MIRSVIIDDESSAIRNLTNIISNFCSDVEIVGSAQSVVEGIKLINAVDPELVFLDIQMPDGSGFDMLECIQNKTFDLIFVTSFNQHAIKAFKYSAADYLLKPVDIDELTSAITRIKEKRSSGASGQYFKDLIDNLQGETPSKIAITSATEKEYVPVLAIIRLEASGSYSEIFLKNGRKLVASKKIKEFEEILLDHAFFRVHNSHMINMHEVIKYNKKDGGWIEMTDGTEVPLARRRKALFDMMMKKLTNGRLI